MASSHTACHAVLNTTELLESIILQLPIEKVLRVQSVSKQWQNTIIESPNLQVALFLKPFGRGAQSVGKNVDMQDNKDCRSTRTTPALINPILCFVSSEVRSWSNRIEVYLDIHDSSFLNLTRKHCKGSWKSMQLAQPAIYHLKVTCNACYYYSYGCQHTFTFSNPTGITILNVLMAARTHAEMCQCGWHVRPGQSSPLATLQIDAKMAEMAVLLRADKLLQRSWSRWRRRRLRQLSERATRMPQKPEEGEGRVETYHHHPRGNRLRTRNSGSRSLSVSSKQAAPRSTLELRSYFRRPTLFFARSIWSAEDNEAEPRLSCNNPLRDFE